jgi:hypothetical protein
MNADAMAAARTEQRHWVVEGTGFLKHYRLVETICCPSTDADGTSAAAWLVDEGELATPSGLPQKFSLRRAT